MPLGNQQPFLLPHDRLLCRRDLIDHGGQRLLQFGDFLIVMRSPVAEAARRLGVDQTLFRSWKMKFQAEGDQAFPGAGQRTAIEEQLRQLREENARLTRGRDILKLATAFFSRESR